MKYFYQFPISQLERKERMSKKQKEVYVNFLEQNPIINEHRRNDPALNRYWLKLADVLNSVPQGAVKHVAEWKQVSALFFFSQLSFHYNYCFSCFTDL